MAWRLLYVAAATSLTLGCGRSSPGKPPPDSGVAELSGAIEDHEQRLKRIEARGAVDVDQVAEVLAALGRDAGLHGPVGPEGQVWSLQNFNELDHLRSEGLREA